MKAALGLWQQPAVCDDHSLLGCDKHRDWARLCAWDGITLVMDAQKLLPISPGKPRRVLLEVLGHFPSNARVESAFAPLLEQEGFAVTLYRRESPETADFSVAAFRARYDLVIYLANVENASNQVTNRLSWFTFWGNGDNVPWFVHERPVLFISLGNPYHLVDVPMVQTYINAYANHDALLPILLDKLMGRDAFCGASPVDPFCGKPYLSYGEEQRKCTTNAAGWTPPTD
jgi:beta-N-acetylhexosaminidase